MKATGIVRRMDDLGRIRIPKAIREMTFGNGDQEGEAFEIFIDEKEQTILLKKYETEN